MGGLGSPRKVYGLGADGTVGANKNSVQIIGIEDNKPEAIRIMQEATALRQIRI